MTETIPFRDRLACTRREAAQATSLGLTSLKLLIRDGRIKATKVGARTLVSVPSLVAFLEPDESWAKHGEPRGRSSVSGTDARGSDASLPAQDCPICLWCGRQFRLRTTGGSPQRFCCAQHRHDFGTAARRWTVRALDAGLLTVEGLKGGGNSLGSSVCAVGKDNSP